MGTEKTVPIFLLGDAQTRTCLFLKETSIKTIARMNNYTQSYRLFPCRY
jgi:hypothetical protein